MLDDSAIDLGQRRETIGRLRQDPHVPVLILGGGINGVGLLRELALQGVRCLLVDRADFAAGATSKSSRMIHGGLRYLENREVGLVREALIERNRLLENAAHFVSPLRTTIPLFSRLGGLVRSALIFFGLPVRPGARGAWITRIGLSYYDWVTRKGRRTPTHFLSSRDASLREIRGLDPEIIGTATYWDACITEAERLCIELVQDAVRANPECAALNYAAPRGVKDGGVCIEDLTTGESFTVRPDVVVNATGAWVDAANAALGAETHFMGGTRGSHLVVDSPELLRALGDRMVYYQHADGRVCIVYPFLGKVIMGSTDIPTDDPDAARCEEEEVDYMLETLHGVLPGVRVGREEIVFAFSGVRPLPAERAGVPGQISRGHTIHDLEPAEGRPFPITCLVGGKLTTFRALAEQAADHVLGRLGLERRCSTAGTPIGGGKGFPSGPDARAEWVRHAAREWGVSEERADVLLSRYGTAAVAYACSDETPLQALPDYTAGEIRAIAADEAVVHLADLVYRRSTIGILGNATPAVLHELAGVVGNALGWDEARREREIELARPQAVAGAPHTSP